MLSPRLCGDVLAYGTAFVAVLLLMLRHTTAHHVLDISFAIEHFAAVVP